MKRLRIIILSTLLLSFINVLSANTLEKTFIDNNIYIGSSIGYSYLSSSKNTSQGTVTLNEKLNSSSKNINLELGFEYSKNIDISINYQRVNNDNVSLDNTYMSIKYKFPQEQITPYVGTNLGYSQMSWDKDPINSANNDTVSGSYLLGLKIGSYYKINKSVDLDLNYNISYMNHKTKLNSSNVDIATIEHDYLHSFNIGFIYRF